MKRALTGLRFDRWLVLGKRPISSPKGSLWKCLCDCGTSRMVRGCALLSGHSRSCGCLQSDVARKLKLTHGRTGTPTYVVWLHMMARCENPSNFSYPSYGGRGIRVCKAWKKFEIFLRDMGEKPQSLTLERINNDKGYSPSNCKWASWKEQSRNKRNNLRLTAMGKTQCLADWCEQLNLHKTTIRRRLLSGWSHPAALGLSK